ERAENTRNIHERNRLLEDANQRLYDELCKVREQFKTTESFAYLAIEEIHKDFEKENASLKGVNKALAAENASLKDANKALAKQAETWKSRHDYRLSGLSAAETTLAQKDQEIAALMAQVKRLQEKTDLQDIDISNLKETVLQREETIFGLSNELDAKEA
ncbi:hypothetical protein, partial [Gluconobacter kondonii]|uniref:hypothetical protein n=1 Tax=Gluconobacter kondonii TaxID=941463 RepID=UPI001B8BED9A